MNPLTEAQLRLELRGDEGEVLKVYDDKTGRPIGPGTMVIGNPSIAVGRNLSGRGLTIAESEFLLSNDLVACETELAPTMPWITTLTPARQTVIYSLYFNTGLGNPARFEAKWPNFLAQMKAGQFAAAADNLESSQPWATEVGPRARRLGELVRYG
jgi:GH24 family phage-related lysozyme (muramidase)